MATCGSLDADAGLKEDLVVVVVVVINSLREFALCYSRYPPTRACGWVVGSRPDGDAIAGTAGRTGIAG